MQGLCAKMKKTLLIGIAVLFVTSCEAPLRTAHAELQTLRAQAGQKIQDQCLDEYPGEDQQAEVDRCIKEDNG